MRRKDVGARTRGFLDRFRDIMFRYRPIEETMMTQRRRNLHRYALPFVYSSQQQLLLELQQLRDLVERAALPRRREDALLRDVLRHQLDFHIRYIRCPTLRFLEVNHLTNPFSDMQWLLRWGWSEYVGSADRLKDRVAAFFRSMDEIRIQMRDGAFLGITLPRRSAVFLIANLRRLEDWFRTTRPRHALASTARRLARDVAAYMGPWIAFLQDEYLPRAREEIGLLTLPGGREAYREILKLHTGRDDLEPEEVERLGRALLRELRTRRDALPNPSSASPDGFRSFEEAREAFARCHENLRTSLKETFPEPPTYRSAAIVPVPEEEASGAITAAYDGRVILSAETLQRSETVGLSLHEHWPGHHLQSEWASYVAGEVHEALQLMYSNDVIEGWGLYAEGFLPEDAPTEVRRAQLEAEMFRAARLVVDVGIHWHGWGEAKAVQFLRRTLPWMPLLEIQNEVLRYAVLPGQALSYTIGKQCLQGLARKFNGPEAAFHEFVLRHSFLPCCLLDKYLPRAGA